MDMDMDGKFHIHGKPGERPNGVLFSIDCLFVSLLARLRENGWTDLHEIFREGVE